MKTFDRFATSLALVVGVAAGTVSRWYESLCRTAFQTFERHTLERRRRTDDLGAK